MPTDKDPPTDRDAIARSTDPGTSWAAAGHVNKSKLNALYYEQLYYAGVRGKTTNAMARDTGKDRDSFSPRHAQMQSIVEVAGTRLELNKNGKLRPFHVYRLKIFNPDKSNPLPWADKDLPLLLGWQILKKDKSNGR